MYTYNMPWSKAWFRRGWMSSSPGMDRYMHREEAPANSSQ